MTRRSKRELEREIDDLAPDDTDDTAPIVLKLTHVPHRGKQYPEWSDSPHPELTVRPHPEQKPKSLTIAVPNQLPREYGEDGILIVGTCGQDREHDDPTPACELWDALSDEQLREEYRIREENGDPIPELLEDYAPKE